MHTTANKTSFKQMMQVSLNHLNQGERTRLRACLFALQNYETRINTNGRFSVMKTSYKVDGRTKYTFSLLHEEGGSMVLGTFLVGEHAFHIWTDTFIITHLKEGLLESFEIGFVRAMQTWVAEQKEKERWT